MSVVVRTWQDEADYKDWLEGFALGHGFAKPEDLFNLIELEELDDDPELWSWAQHWGFAQAATQCVKTSLDELVLTFSIFDCVIDQPAHCCDSQRNSTLLAA